MKTIEQQIEVLTSLPNDWNGYGSWAPNDAAGTLACNVLHLLVCLDVVPSRVVPSAEGGIGIYLPRPDDGYVLVECMNTGEVVVGRSDRKGHIWIWSTLSRIYDAIAKIGEAMPPNDDATVIQPVYAHDVHAT